MDIDLSDLDPIHEQMIDIRIRQINKKKSQTYVENLPFDFNYNDIGKIKKYCCCSGNVSVSKDGIKYILLFGDQRDKMKEYLVKNNISKASNIVCHGC